MSWDGRRKNDSGTASCGTEKEEKVMRRENRTLIGVAVAAPLLLSATLSAAVVIVDIDISDGTSDQIILNGVPTGPGSTQNFVDTYISGNGNTVLNFDFNANAVGSETAFLNAVWTLENMSGGMLNYTIQMTLLLDSGTGPITTYGGSGSFGLTGGQSGSAGPFGGNPMLTLLADGNALDDGTLAPFGPGGGGNVGPFNGAIGPVNNSIGLLFQFGLNASAGQNFSTNSLIGIIPGPSALAMIGLAGLATGRRRRR
jgi:hypothetical protein